MQHTPDAEHYEGDAEKLTHIERHAYLEIALHLFAELHEEAEGEDGGEAVAEEEAGAHLTGHAAIEIPAEESEHGIGDSLIELCGVAGEHIDLREDESPVTSCGAAYNLGIQTKARDCSIIK